jgi:hypothetical protein
MLESITIKRENEKAMRFADLDLELAKLVANEFRFAYKIRLWFVKFNAIKSSPFLPSFTCSNPHEKINFRILSSVSLLTLNPALHVLSERSAFY